MTNFVQSARILVAVPLLALVGCQAPGENLRADVYQANQVNTAQNAMVANILAVMPARIEADNTQQKQVAQLAGGILGAVAGGVVGSNIAGRNKVAGTALGAVG